MKSVLFTGQAFAAAQQFGIDLREFLDLVLELVVVLNPRLSDLPLGGCFKEEFIHFTRGQALGQVVEGSMFIPAMVAGAVGFATAGEPLDQGGAQCIREDLELRNQKAFAPAQGQGGFVSGGMNLRQISRRWVNAMRAVLSNFLP